MRIFDYINNFVNKIKGKKQNELLLDLPENLYTNFISTPQIDNIINNMPQNLSEIEKAYYIYLELGKIVSENPKFVFTNREGKKIYYNNVIDNEYWGNCKAISELYVSILKDKRIGISADLVKQTPESPITHVDTILKIDGKNYIVNLISDLSRIKTSCRVNSFCFDLSRPVHNSEFKKQNEIYLKRLEQYYSKIDNLTREDIEQLDKKLGYSYFIPKISKEDERGFYTEDVIELLREDMSNPESFRKYVLHNRDVPEEELLKYKLDYIFENINKWTHYNNTMNYLENIRYYLYVYRKMLSPEELSRIQDYAAIRGNDFSRIISILKIKPLKESDDKKNNIYYLYSANDKKYVYRTPEEMKQFLYDIDENSFHIIGTLDRFNPKEKDELEL